MFGVTTEEAQLISHIQVTVCVENDKLASLQITYKLDTATTVTFTATYAY